ncbi:hypothetical protein HK097_011676 [Rhizophlyctis rosea]|uniref:Uncharacterized protein n=1 Tax=Rhizophlyctis rosea TaxID=64517 RepID=A0AAD5SGM0_9FUNG|nr:hypothetical protein HK097_011676 [Rhizophlyctis rosea]
MSVPYAPIIQRSDPNATTRTIQGIVLDMDGTITHPILDFALMRTRLAIPSTTDILHHLHSLSGSALTEATKIIHDMEHEAMLAMTVQEGFSPLMRFVQSRDPKMPKAIFTRNRADCVDWLRETFCEKDGFTFDIILTRDFLPVKPDPAGLVHIAKEWNIDPTSLMMVGDSKDDMQCARGAGAVGVLLRNDHNADVETLADLVVHDLEEIVGLLEKGFTVQRQ